MAQSRHPDALNQCPLSGVKQTLIEYAAMSAFDPKRTFAWKRLAAEAVQ
jgi:hypothetical protein